MHNIETHIIEHWSHLKNVHLFVACSGGLDSMVLLHSFSSLGYDVTALHVNYQLRGEDSELDKLSVQRFCKENTIPFESIIGSVNADKNLQESAREIRYSWFDSKMKEQEGSKTLFAHHADDQVETFFMNLARKSGILGMACMPAENGNYVRPLLPFSKSELLDYALQKKLIWREDRSNATSKYRRNYLRNEIIPALYKQYPELKSSILELISAFQRTQTAIEMVIAPILNGIHATHQLPFTVFDELSSEEKFELFRQFGVTGKELNELEKIRNSSRGKRLNLRDDLFSAIFKDDTHFTFLTSERKSIILRTEEVATLPEKFSKKELYLDKKRVDGTLLLRSPAEGDRISPLGMQGTQLISAILKDSKMDANEKLNALVLCDDSTIHWLVGHKIGRLALAQPTSTHIVKCTISEEVPQ